MWRLKNKRYKSRCKSFAKIGDGETSNVRCETKLKHQRFLLTSDISRLIIQYAIISGFTNYTIYF